jgi:hypothetical protein
MSTSLLYHMDRAFKLKGYSATQHFSVTYLI